MKIIYAFLFVFTLSLVAQAQQPDVTHSFLATGSRTYIADNNGKILWKYPHATRDGHVLADGTILLTVKANKKGDFAFPGGGVVIVNRAGEQLFSYKGTQKEVNSAQPLDNGNIVLTEAGPSPRLLEIDRDGEVIVEFPLSCQKKNFHLQTRMARKLPDGTYLVPHLLDFAVKQYDATGKVIQTIDTALPDDPERKVHTWPFTSIRLANGDTVVNCTQGNRVTIFDLDGKRVWELTNDDLPGPWLQDPCGGQVLPNGNIVVCSYAAGRIDRDAPKIFEVNRKKEVVWTYRDGKKKGLHTFQILSTNGKPLDEKPGAAIAEPQMQDQPTISARDWGQYEGQPVQLWTLTNANGLVLKATNFGATITELHLPDRDGNVADVILGFDRLEPYTGDHPYFGGIVGRYSNRIAQGKFSLEGKGYNIPVNNGKHTLHGGLKSFDRRYWKGTSTMTDDGPSVTFTRVSPDGEEGFPGNLDVTVTYLLNNDNQLVTTMNATTDQTTVVSLIQHAYWNLSGHDSGDILDHEVQVFADQFTQIDAEAIPTGELASVAETPVDFRQAKTIGRDLAKLDGNGVPLGFDHNFVIPGETDQMRKVATVSDPQSGRRFTLSSNQPGMQFYVGTYLDGTNRGKGDFPYQKYAGFNMETQKWPNSPNISHFPSPVLKPGETYKHVMITEFSVDSDE